MSDRDLLRAHGIAGAIGSLVLAIGALSMGWLPPLFKVDQLPWLEALRSSTSGELLGRTAVLVGGALVLQSWLLLGADVLGDRLVDVRTLWRILGLWLLPTLLVPPLFSRDAYSYFIQGRLMTNGLDPYTNGAAALSGWFRAGVDPMWAETPTPYGPLFLLIERAVVELFQTPFWSAVGFRFVSVLGIVLAAWAVPRLAHLHGIDPAAALWLAVLNPLVLLHFALGAHNDALMVGLMLCGLYAAMRRRVVGTIALLAAAMSIKPIAIVVVPFAALAFLPRSTGLWKRIGAYASGIGAVLGVMLLSGVAIGVGAGWIHALTTPGSVRTWLSPPTAIGMAVGLLGQLFGDDELDSTAVAIVRLVCILAALGICAWLLLKPRGRSPIRGAVLAFTAVIFLGPVVQPWYLLWALPLIAVTGLRKAWHLKAVVLGTAVMVIYGLAEPTATSDAHLDLIDSLGFLMAIALVAFVVLASPRERMLALGSQFARGLAPRDEGARSRAAMWIVR